MKILSISNMDIWPEGENIGIPSIFFSQKIFAQKGFEVNFLCPAIDKKAGDYNYEGVSIHRFNIPGSRIFALINVLPLNRFFSHILSTILSNVQWLLFQILCLFWSLRLASNNRPDIVYVHGLNSVFVGWLISRIFSTKLIFRIYGVRDLYWEYQKPLVRIKEFRDYLAFKLDADYFIITKDGTRGALLANTLGVKEEKIINLRNGVDFDIYNPQLNSKEKVCKDLTINKDSKIILSTARLIPFYGVETLVFSLPALFKIDLKAMCIIAGDGPQKNQLQEFVKKNNISDRVFFLGAVQRQVVAQLFNSCDVFVTLSGYSNTNNSLFEAMVCARCIVSLKDDTIDETLVHNKNAIFVQPQAIDKLPEILAKVLGDQLLREELGKQAQIRAREILETWPVRIDREVKLLEALVSRQPIK
jgi:glycosyltransferase involved in cell wall biosynthesis